MIILKLNTHGILIGLSMLPMLQWYCTWLLITEGLLAALIVFKTLVVFFTH